MTRRDEGTHLDDHHAVQLARALGKLEHFDAGERPKEDCVPGRGGEGRGRAGVELEGRRRGGEEASR